MKLTNNNANKITSGTLGASKANVINLDANRLTGNKASFVQSAWNSLNSTVSIDVTGVDIENTLDI